MGLIVNDIIDENCILGMWEIKEDFDTLYSQVKLDSKEEETLNSFKNDNRKLEWLSVRALLNTITQKESKIIYNDEHKPFLFDGSYNISISHSNTLTSILLGKDKKVGIDLEYMSHRISKISHKFINSNEVITSDHDLVKLHLYIHWCAKEALYKICDKRNINFKDNLTIRPFTISPEGDIVGIHHDVNLYDEFNLHYMVRNNYSIVYCIK